MALNENIKVKMPEHCVKVPKNGTTYIQYTVRAYRNKQGKPTGERIAIGKLDAETGMLIPNRNYYEIFCAFIALIVHSFMRNHLAEYMQTHKLTFEKILPELRKSKQSFSPKYPSGSRPINPPSKTLRDVFHLCGLDIVC